IRTSSTTTTVLSGLNVRLASLYGSVMRRAPRTPPRTSSTATPHCLCHAPAPSERRAVELPGPAYRAQHGAQRAGRPVHVESHLDQLGDDALHLRVGRPLLHYDNHVCVLLFYFQRAATRRLPGLQFLSVPFEPPRFVDDALEQPADGGRVQWSRIDVGHVREDFPLA